METRIKAGMSAITYLLYCSGIGGNPFVPPVKRRRKREGEEEEEEGDNLSEERGKCNHGRY
jgi:hypothetical protein